MITKTFILLAVCFGGISFLFYRYINDEDASDEKKIIDAWKAMIKPPPEQFKKLAVGINANIDIIVSGTALLKALRVSPSKQRDHPVLSTLDHLQETFAYFFSRGSAAERSFLDHAIYQKIIETTETLNDIEHFVGGNAALMATKASALFPNLKIHFVGPVGPLLLQLMPKSVNIPKSCLIPRDEVHLIMEYKVGEKWGDAAAPVATRFITSYDEMNSKILMMEPFFESIKTFKPDLIMLSGLHLLDGQATDLFQRRLETLVERSKDIPLSIPIHLELASMANKNFVKEIVEKVFMYVTSSIGLNEQELGLLSITGGGPHQDLIPAVSDNEVLPRVDSLGLNEQEIIFSSKAAGGPHGNHLDEEGHSQPEIYKISDIILWLFKKYGRSADKPVARLTRIHFHSLTYHIVGVLDSAWSGVDNAAAAGTQIAGLQACDISELSEDMIELQIPKRIKFYTGDMERDFDPKNPVVSWTIDGYRFVFSPVLVCKKPLKTVGLGDAISATGLMYSKFHS